MGITSFADLRKNREQSMASLTAKVAEMAKGGGGNDAEKANYWQPTVDKAGNGYAIIRFLPAAPGEEDAFVRTWDHGFQGPGGWYIEKSLTTIGQQDPVSEYNSELWNASTDDNSPERKQARNQKRRLSYVANILVIKDPGNPDNDGKVFKYKFGKKIWDKINAKMFPEFADEQAFNPFDLWEGANFRLKIRKVEGYRNYDSSSFDAQSALFDDDDKMEAVWKQCHSLKALLDPATFKSYDELKARLDRVLNGKGKGGNESAARQSEDRPSYTPPAEAPSKPAPSAPSRAAAVDDDEDAEFFGSFAE